MQILPYSSVPLHLEAGSCSCGQPVLCYGPVHVQPSNQGMLAALVQQLFSLNSCLAQRGRAWQWSA